MRLPNVPSAYSTYSERERNRTIELADKANRKTAQNVDIGGEKLILTSPNGTRYSVTVDNAGTIAATAI